jgi:predicted heme/steroid binding protein
MLSHDSNYSKTKEWNGDNVPTFSLVLSSSAALEGKKHVDLYRRKGLMKRLEGITQLASWMGMDPKTLQSTLVQYQQDAEHGQDEWGKTTFQGVFIKDLEKEVFYVGTVQPVLHYCMGGITIDTEGSVLDENGEIIQGLHAVGEVTGGVHGDNRLGGNSLLECAVFGTIVGKKLPVRAPSDESGSAIILRTSTEYVKELGREVTMKELQRHNSPGDCWVAIDGIVYDLTSFADLHPGGANAIHALAGTDGTSVFLSVHSTGLLNAFVDNRIGQLVSTVSTK